MKEFLNLILGHKTTISQIKTLLTLHNVRKKTISIWLSNLENPQQGEGVISKKIDTAHKEVIPLDVQLDDDAIHTNAEDHPIIHIAIVDYA